MSLTPFDKKSDPSPVSVRGRVCLLLSNLRQRGPRPTPVGAEHHGLHAHKDVGHWSDGITSAGRPSILDGSFRACYRPWKCSAPASAPVPCVVCTSIRRERLLSERL